MSRTRTPLPEPTPRQREVIKLLVRGHTNSEIAERLAISLAGAKWHVSELLGKFGVDSREELIEIWERERRIGARAGRWLSGVLGMGTLKLGAAAAGLAVATLAVAATVPRGGGADAPAAESATGAPASTPTPIPEPTIPVPDPLLALADDYDAAADLVVSCGASQGVTIVKVPGDRLLKPTFTFSAPTTAEGEARRLIMEGCKATHLAPVDALWTGTMLADRTAREAEASKLMAACMRDAGIAVRGDRATRDEARRWALMDPSAQGAEREIDAAESQAWRNCNERIGAEVGIGW